MEASLRRFFAFVKFAKSRTFAVGALSVVLAAMIFTVSSITNAVYIRDGENVSLQFTIKQDVNEILNDNGINVMAYDKVDFSGFKGKLGEINIQRAFPVTVRADGVEQSIMVTDGTVSDALAKTNVIVAPTDTVNHSMSKPLERGDYIVVERVQKHILTVDKVIPYETEIKETSLLAVGKKKVLVNGVSGKQTLTYEETLVDGVATDKVLISTDVTKKPQNAVVLVGAKKAISPLVFDNYPLDKNGVPANYKKLLANQSATGYSARAGAKTASGKYAKTGYIAVNPNVIPYGTKMYIASPDNKFIYGYCIAADTGSGLIAGHTDVDLFYDTYLESCLNGRRNVNIYILE